MKIGPILFLHRDHLGRAADPYMRRFKIIDTPWFAIRIHRILRSDSGRHLHDHPWSFLSIVLRGGYWEFVPENWYRGHIVIQGITKITAPAIVFHRAEDLHRLDVERPATTLVFCGPRRREWGFQTESGWVPWTEYPVEFET